MYLLILIQLSAQGNHWCCIEYVHLHVVLNKL